MVATYRITFLIYAPIAPPGVPEAGRYTIRASIWRAWIPPAAASGGRARVLRGRGRI